MAKRTKKTPEQSSMAITNNFLGAANAEAMRAREDYIDSIKNGLSDAILGFDPMSIGTQITQVDTLFTNLRWYLVSNMRQPLSQAYAEIGLIQTIVDVPVDDGLRGGVEVKSKQLSEDEIQELHTAIEREKDLTNVGQALKWNRLYGGAGLVIVTGADCSEPFSLDEIKEDEPFEVRAVDMWELFADKQNTEGFNPALQVEQAEFFNYYGKKLHTSRVMKMVGKTAPSFIRPRLRGWGLSVVEALITSINQYLKANNLSFEVLDEFKLDIFKIKNLTNTLLSPNGDAQVRKRVALANQQKNFQNAIVMDGEDDYQSKQLSFAGLAEAMQGIRMQVASDMRMPLTKLFGISAAGFSSGEDDIENYNSMIESEVREKSKFDILRIIEIRCKQLFGYVPDDLQIDFKPLRILSAEQEETVKTQKFNRLLQALQAGAITAKEFKEACNRDSLLVIQVDASIDELTPSGSDGDVEGKADSASAPKSQIGAPAPKEPAEPKLINEIVSNPGNVDEGLWKKAKEASMKAFGKIKYAFVTWWYKKQGGTFK